MAESVAHRVEQASELRGFLGRKKIQDDELTIAVYEKAGFPPPSQDVLLQSVDFLAEARKDAIRERSGQRTVGTWAVAKNPEEVLAHSGFDRTMRESLQKSASPMDLVVFMAHIYQIQANDSPPLRQSSPAGCYNRALVAMREDGQAIDDAVAAITGRRPGGPGK